MSFALGANPMICIGIVRHFTHVPRAFKAKKLATARCGRFCGSLERHFWYAWEICRGANAILSSKIVIWDLKKNSRQVKVLKNTANQGQALTSFSLSEPPQNVETTFGIVLAQKGNM